MLCHLVIIFSTKYANVFLTLLRGSKKLISSKHFIDWSHSNTTFNYRYDRHYLFLFGMVYEINWKVYFNQIKWTKFLRTKLTIISKIKILLLLVLRNRKTRSARTRLFVTIDHITQHHTLCIYSRSMFYLYQKHFDC